MRAHRGFTLIELMIVVAIIAVLAAIALPAYQAYIARSQVTESLSLSSGIGRAVLENYWQTGTCVKSGDPGIPAADQVQGSYVASIEAAGTATATGGCTMTITLRSNTSPPLQGKTVMLTLVTDSSSSRWICTSTIQQRYLPRDCTGT